MPNALPPISVIVPTLNEALNIKSLVTRICSTFKEHGMTGEIVIVDDDSTDDTQAVVDAMAERYPVRCIVRHDCKGLSASVLHGFRVARHDIFVVMDADLQHPPETIPPLVHAIVSGGADIAFGSRFISGGTIHEQWSLARRIVSYVAMLMTRPLLPIRDPASGFFAISRETWLRASQVRPIGFKIGLELAIKAGCQNFTEIPIAFGTRRAGDSKLTLMEEIRFLRHLLHLYIFRLKGGPSGGKGGINA